MSIHKRNVYIVETPLQLLNAIEAKHNLELINNHLVVRLGGTGFPPNMLKQLVDRQEWDYLDYIIFKNTVPSFNSNLWGLTMSTKLRGYSYDYQQYYNRSLLRKLAHSIGPVKNIFLGNYLKGSQLYMRHFANILAHESLYLLDDGTDVMLVTQQRRRSPLAASQQVVTEPFFTRMRKNLRRSLVDWNEEDEPNVIYFTAYDIVPGHNDAVVRNDYSYLRQKIRTARTLQEAHFLGQPLIQDEYVTEATYLHFLSMIKNHFGDLRLVYLPHPRESTTILQKIIDHLDIEVRHRAIPIEYHVAASSERPEVLSSFFCSALTNCQTILGDQLHIISFYISPEHFLNGETLARTTYDHFQCHSNPYFQIVRLEGNNEYLDA